MAYNFHTRAAPSASAAAAVSGAPPGQRCIAAQGRSRFGHWNAAKMRRLVCGKL
jgi:hypothetical protein